MAINGPEAVRKDEQGGGVRPNTEKTRDGTLEESRSPEVERPVADDKRRDDVLRE